MDFDLAAYIKNQLASGRSFQDIVSELKSSNVDDATISDAVTRAFQQTAAVEKPEQSQIDSNLPQSETNKVESTPRKKIDATKAFLFIGALFIAVATIIVITSSWSEVGPFGKVSFLGLPMIALFALTYWLNFKDELKRYSPWTMILGFFIFPFFIGTALYQFGLLSTVDSNLLIATSLISLPVFIVAEFVYRKQFMSMFTLVGFYTLFLSIISKLELSDIGNAWSIVFLSAVVFLVGLFFTRNKLTNHKPYLLTPAVVLSLAIPFAILETINNNSFLEFETNCIIISLIGFAYLFLASGTSSLCQKLENDQAVYMVKRYFEEIAIWIVVFPFIAAGFSSDSGFYIGVALLLSIIAVLASIRVSINSLLAVGAIGVIASVLTISSRFFADSLGWPIIVFIAGFAAIGIGLAIKRIKLIRKENFEHEMFFGLGKDESIESGHPKISTGRIILVVVGVLIAIPIVITIIRYAYFYSVESNDLSGYQKIYYQRNVHDNIPAANASVTNNLPVSPYGDY